MSVRCLSIGDPHFKTKNRREMELFVQKTIEVAKEYNPDFIVNLGDTLDTHEKIHVVPLTQSIQWMEEISKIAPLYLIIGNHDRPNNSDFLSEFHPFHGLQCNENIFIVHQTLEVVINTEKFIFVPYVPPGQFLNALEGTDYKNSTMIFAHQEFYGCQMGAIKSTEGDVWDESYPLVVSGHIHDYQQIQDNIIYTGTPIQHTFGDVCKKTISEYVIDKEDGGIIENRISLNVTKKKIIHTEINDILSIKSVDDLNFPENTLVKLVIHGDQSKITSFKISNKYKEIFKLCKMITFDVNFEEYKSIQGHQIKNRDTLNEKIYQKINKSKNRDDLMKWYKIFI